MRTFQKFSQDFFKIFFLIFRSRLLFLLVCLVGLFSGNSLKWSEKSDYFKGELHLIFAVCFFLGENGRFGKILDNFC